MGEEAPLLKLKRPWQGQITQPRQQLNNFPFHLHAGRTCKTYCPTGIATGTRPERVLVLDIKQNLRRGAILRDLRTFKFHL